MRDAERSVARPLPPLDPAMDASQNHYWSYQGLDALLACKKPLTASQDEDLFITVHQVCELAFHQMILDLDRTLDALAEALAATPTVPMPAAPESPATPAPPALLCGATGEAVYFLRRVNALWGTVNLTMPILASMRAFAEFRTSIGPTSGFQSVQFRRLEIMAGVPVPYWHGGTADAQGTPHVAETEFERRHGAEVAAWFARYRHHSLRAYGERLLERAAPEALKADAEAGPLVRALAAYDAAQLAFHRAHLGLAVTQLRRVGVEVGTGGTSFKTYLQTYEGLSPLLPAFAEA